MDETPQWLRRDRWIDKLTSFSHLKYLGFQKTNTL